MILDVDCGGSGIKTKGLDLCACLPLVALYSGSVTSLVQLVAGCFLWIGLGDVVVVLIRSSSD